MDEAGATPAHESIGPYRVIRELGRGGMGVVYEVENPQLKKRFALKALQAGEQLAPELVARFRREAEAMARIDRHPGIVSIADVGQEGTRLYFTMELVGGGDLDGLLSTADVSPAQAAELTAAIADALEHAHRHGIVHRDLKPANVLLDYGDRPDAGLSPRPKLTDFGLAHDAHHQTRLTTSGVAMGTPVYMSPEQAAGKSNAIDARTDVYAAGAVLYELLTNAPPFDADSSAAVIMQVMTRDPRPPRAANPLVPRELEAICMRAMEKDPAKRYQSAAALRDDLRAWIEGRPISAKPIGRIGWLWRRARRNPAALAGAVVAAAAVLGAAGYGWHVWSSAAAKDAAREARATEALPHLAEGTRLLELADRYRFIQDIAVRELESTIAGADAAFCRAIAADDTQLQAYQSRALVRRWQLRLDDAIADLDRVIALQPELATAYVARGELHCISWFNARPLIVAGRAMDEFGEFYGAMRLVRSPANPKAEHHAAAAAADLAAAERLGASEPALRRLRALVTTTRTPVEELASVLPMSRAAAEADPTDPGPLTDYARLLYVCDRFADSLKAAERVIKVSPNYALALDVYAHALFYNQRWTEAEAALARARLFMPTSPELMRMHAQVALELKQFKRAQALFEEARTRDGAVADPLESLALLRLGRLAEAETLARSLVDDPTHGHNARSNLASVLILADRPAEAIPVLDQLIDSRDEDRAIDLGLRGLAKRRTGDIAGAEADYRAALDLDADSVAVLQNYAYLLAQTGRAAEALPFGRRACELRPDGARQWRSHGGSCLHAREFDEARRSFERALELQPDEPSVLTALAEAHIGLNDWTAALRALRHSDALRPNYPLTLRLLGRTAREMGDREAALRYFDAALTAEPGHAKALNQRGILKVTGGDVPGALADFRAAVQADPTLAPAMANLARAAMQSGLADEATAALAAWGELDPGAIEPPIVEGQWHFKAKRPAKALAAFERAVAIQPDHPNAVIGRGLALLELGRPRDALAALERGLQLEPRARGFLAPHIARARAESEGK